MPTAHTSPLRPIELLAPARTADIAIEAIRHGADAVYMGAVSHGARSAAANSLEDISRVIDFAHRFGARVYITVNTLVYDHELRDVERLIRELYRREADALIVQDMALLRMNLPPIALHASTQCDIRTPEKAAFLQAAGFSQLVLPRELTLEETAAIAGCVSVPVEAFVHGALCVSYSGDCQAGFATMGRSANRGECPQICRHKFDLTDAAGNVIVKGKHLLSLRDLNRTAHLRQMLEAGVTSFKIEGRLKDAAYVKNIVGHYRRLFDRIIAESPQKYCSSSFGRTMLSFSPDPDKSFNRGYTDYFTITAKPRTRMASPDTPKWVGQPVGEVVSTCGRRLEVRLTDNLANGDGLGYFDRQREFHGFRLNRIEGNCIYTAQPVDIPLHTTLYRNSDRRYSAVLESDTACRRIDIGLTLRTTPYGLTLDIADRHGHSASVTAAADLSEARTPQADTRRDVLSKTGDTVYDVITVTDLAGNRFVPKSMLADLRRRATAALDRAIRIAHCRPLRVAECHEASYPVSEPFTYHDNVANRLAETFYRDHGATVGLHALETEEKPATNGLRVMTARYCLRREFGRCLRTRQGKEWPSDLRLISGPIAFRLDFDCATCRMHVIIDSKQP